MNASLPNPYFSNAFIILDAFLSATRESLHVAGNNKDKLYIYTPIKTNSNAISLLFSTFNMMV